VILLDQGLRASKHRFSFFMMPHSRQQAHKS
jgi:hypothetical protein